MKFYYIHIVALPLDVILIVCLYFLFSVLYVSLLSTKYVEM